MGFEKWLQVQVSIGDWDYLNIQVPGFTHADAGNMTSIERYLILPSKLLSRLSK